DTASGARGGRAALSELLAGAHQREVGTLLIWALGRRGREGIGPLKAGTPVRIPLGPTGELSGTSSGFPDRERSEQSPSNAAKYPRMTPRSGSGMAAPNWTGSPGATTAQRRPELQ